MSATGDHPLELGYRPIFDSLPYVLDTLDNGQSFPFLPGFYRISFEEQRLRDISKPPPMAIGNVGKFSSSVLRSPKAACTNYKTAKIHDLDLLRPSLPIVMIRVGKGESTSTFAIHKNILEHCSPFFDSIWTSDPASDTVHELNPREDSVESGTQVQKEELRNAKMESVIEVKLDADVAAFGLYTEWVYSGHIQKGSLKTEKDDIDFSPIGQAYILGEKLQDQKFKNAIVNFLLQTIVTQGKMDLNLPMLIFNETSNSAPLRKFLVDLYVRYGHKDWLKPDDSKVTIPAVFLSDLSSALLDRHGHDGAPKAKIPALTVCNYHEHPDGEVCSNVTRHPRAIVEPKSEP